MGQEAGRRLQSAVRQYGPGTAELGGEEAELPGEGLRLFRPDRQRSGLHLRQRQKQVQDDRRHRRRRQEASAQRRHQPSGASGLARRAGARRAHRRQVQPDPAVGRQEHRRRRAHRRSGFQRPAGLFGGRQRRNHPGAADLRRQEPAARQAQQCADHERALQDRPAADAVVARLRHQEGGDRQASRRLQDAAGNAQEDDRGSGVDGADPEGGQRPGVPEVRRPRGLPEVRRENLEARRTLQAAADRQEQKKKS